MEKEIFDRMERFIRETERRHAVDFGEAAKIIKLLDPPVDPDLLAAREISKTEHETGFTGTPIVERAALAGIKFGRAHALSDLAKLPDDSLRATKMLDRDCPGDLEIPAHVASRLIQEGMAYGRAQLEPTREIPPILQDLIDAREIVANTIDRFFNDSDKSASVRQGYHDQFSAVCFTLSHLTSRREP